MWRPDDWDDAKIVETIIGDYGVTNTERRLVEAGADAMLEAIQELIDLEDARAYGSQCGKCLVLFGVEE